MDYNFLSRVLWVVSIGIVTCGGITILLKGYGRKNILLLFYLGAILLLEAVSYYYSEYNSKQLNIFLFHLSSFVHFFFIALCYYYYFERSRWLKYTVIISIGFILLLLINPMAYEGTQNFHLYTNVLYNLAVVAFSFLYFIGIVIKGIRPQPFELFFNSVVLVYFSYDAIISLSSNFLINEHLDLVAPFWLFRTLLLQLLYVSLINFSWQTGKIRK